MHRRSFIATLPLAVAAPAAAAPAMGHAAQAGSDGWAEVRAASNLELEKVAATNVRVTGSATIDNLGLVLEGARKELVFAEALLIKHDSELQLPNNGEDLPVGPGDALSVVSLGKGAWKATHYQPASVFTKVNRKASHGALPYRLAIGGDATTSAPDFAVEGGANRTKTLIKSIFLNDPGDTPEVALICADGAANAPSARHGGYPGSFIYGWPVDDTGQLFADQSDATDNGFILIGRSQQIAFPIAETPKPRARGGHMVFSVTPNAKRTPIDRQVISQNGRVAFFGNAFESWLGAGGSYPYPLKGLPAAGGGHPVPGLNYQDYAPPGVLTVIASPAETNSAVSIRRWNSPETGFDLDYDFSSGELRLATVAGGAKSARWNWNAEGHLSPAAARSVDLGAEDRPVRAVHADRIDVTRVSAGPAASFRSLHQGFSGDVLALGVSRPAGADFNFLSGSAGGEDGEVKVQISGTGAGAIDGGWVSSGAGYGEYFEWADGNPLGEDRIGISVAASGSKIRPALSDEPPDAIIGVTTARAVTLGNAAWNHWENKYLTDDFGRPVTRTRQHVRWVQAIHEPRQVERVRTVKQEIVRPRKEMVETAEPNVRLQKIGDTWVRSVGQRPVALERTALERVVLHSDDGAPLRDPDGRPVLAEAPVYEQAWIDQAQMRTEAVQVETGHIIHSYPADAIPAGLTPPPDAERFAVREKILNPAFDPGRAYASRADRPEWSAVSLLGRERLRKGQPTSPRWRRLGSISDAVDLWLLR